MRHGAHKVGAGKHLVAQRGPVGAVLDAGLLDEVAYIDMFRASHLTALAVETELQGLIKELRILDAVALVVGARLFRTGIVWFHRRHGAIHGTDGTLETLLEVEFA